MNTPDAALTSKLETKDSQDIFVNKGNICDVDSYSGMGQPLHNWLKWTLHTLNYDSDLV